MATRYEAAKGQLWQIVELFRKTDDGKCEEFVGDKWVESKEAQDVFNGYGTCTFGVTEEEAMKFVNAVQNDTMDEYEAEFKEG